MARVWLCRRDCLEGTLPRLCLVCGRPAYELVEQDFSGTLFWSAPLKYLMGAASGVEAATPTSRAPASRAARAWTAPMNPVPAMPTRKLLSSMARTVMEL